MVKALMGRVFFGKEFRFHSHEGQETREGTSSFSSIQGLQADSIQTKDRLLVSRGHRRILEGATSQKLDEVRKKWGPWRPPGLPLRSSPSSRPPARLRLDVRRAFLVFILVERAGAVAAALAFSATLDSTADCTVDLHQQGLVLSNRKARNCPLDKQRKRASVFHP